jgi:hypothetical protein
MQNKLLAAFPEKKETFALYFVTACGGVFPNAHRSQS